MTRHDLETYRDIYLTGGRNQSLADIWDKIAAALEAHGYDHDQAEQMGLQITEWIRVNWGGCMATDRHVGDPRPAKPLPQGNTPELISVASTVDPYTGSRWASLREHVHALTGAAAVATAVTDTVRRDYGGRYIPSIRNIDRLIRDHEIWSQANTAAQIEAAAKRHGISVVRAYQINRAYQHRLDRIDQPCLPGIGVSS